MNFQQLLTCLKMDTGARLKPPEIVTQNMEYGYRAVQCSVAHTVPALGGSSLALGKFMLLSTQVWPRATVTDGRTLTSSQKLREKNARLSFCWNCTREWKQWQRRQWWCCSSHETGWKPRACFTQPMNNLQMQKSASYYHCKDLNNFVSHF